MDILSYTGICISMQMYFVRTSDDQQVLFTYYMYSKHMVGKSTNLLDSALVKLLVNGRKAFAIRRK